MHRITQALMLITLIACTGCGVGLVGKAIHRAYAKDDVVLVKKVTPPNKIYRRFVITKKFKVFPVMAAPQELVDEGTGMLTVFNRKVRSQEVIVYGNYEQFEQSKEAQTPFLPGKELSKWLETRRKKMELTARMDRRRAEDNEWSSL